MDPLQDHRLDPRRLLVDDQLAGSLAQNAASLPFEGSSARIAAVEHCECAANRGTKRQMSGVALSVNTVEPELSTQT